MNGALKPAMLPIVLIRATPAAAAAPVRNCVGSVQKFGSAAKIAMAVIEMTAMVSTGEPANRASGMLTAPAIGGAGDVPGAEAAAAGVARPEVEGDGGRDVRDRRDEALLEDVELGAGLRLEAVDDRREEERARRGRR